MSKSRLLLASLPAASVLTGDLLLKNAASGQHRTLIPGILSLDDTLNTGFALGLFPDSGVAATILSSLILAGCIFVLIHIRCSSKMLVCFSMIAGGSLGNLHDRIRFSGVRDMLCLDFFPLYIFNLADVAIVTGLILIFLFVLSGREVSE